MIEQHFKSAPASAPEPADCNFYHVMDLPGVGVVGDGWDLRDTVDAYLGNLDLDGRRVLDIGTASGFLSFEAERRGAQVVSFDMASGTQWNVVPYQHEARDPVADAAERMRTHQRLENAYWFAHHALGSKARRFEGDVYDMSPQVGDFDVVVLGMILPHLRDPFQALYSAAQRCRDTLLVTQQTVVSEQPIMRFMPDPATQQPKAAWWVMSDTLMARWFDLLGFDLLRQVTAQHYSIHRGRAVPCTAFVAKRRGAQALADAPPG